jgi:hypothetical protein
MMIILDQVRLALQSRAAIILSKLFIAWITPAVYPTALPLPPRSLACASQPPNRKAVNVFAHLVSHIALRALVSNKKSIFNNRGDLLVTSVPL